jgi:hypothetical protein
VWDGIEIMPLEGQAITCFTLYEFFKRNFSVRVRKIVINYVKVRD